MYSNWYHIFSILSALKGRSVCFSGALSYRSATVAWNMCRALKQETKDNSNRYDPLFVPLVANIFVYKGSEYMRVGDRQCGALIRCDYETPQREERDVLSAQWNSPRHVMSRVLIFFLINTEAILFWHVVVSFVSDDTHRILWDECQAEIRPTDMDFCDIAARV